MELLQKLIELLGEHSGTIVIVGGALLELVLRLFKTEKPMSILALASRWAEKLAQLLQKISDLLSKLVPDKVKSE